MIINLNFYMHIITQKNCLDLNKWIYLLLYTTYFFWVVYEFLKQIDQKWNKLTNNFTQLMSNWKKEEEDIFQGLVNKKKKSK